jgi:WD40 repeat protein
LLLWDVATGRKMRTLEGHRAPCTCAAFSKDGRWIASGSTSGRTGSGGGPPFGGRFPPGLPGTQGPQSPPEVKLWDAESGKEVRSFAGPQFPITAVAIAPDGRRVAALSGSPSEAGKGELHVWELATGKPLYQADGLERVGSLLDWHPHKSQLLSAEPTLTIRDVP